MRIVSARLDLPLDLCRLLPKGRKNLAAPNISICNATEMFCRI